VLSPAHLRANVLVKLGELTGRTHVLPMVLFAPTARCNSRCLSCDWWRADGKTDLAFSEIAALAKELPRFGTRLVVFTGGEPLLRPDVMEIADLFLRQGLALDLLTSGLALEKFAAAIAARFRSVTVSLDGPTAETYRAIRGVNGLEAVTAGVRRLRALAPQMSITARSTISRHNFRLLPELIVKSREMGLDQISFLTADVTSDAFNRPRGLPQVDAAAPPPASPLLLDEDDVGVFAELVESVIRTHADDFRERRIVPGPEGMRRLVATCRAHLGQGPFPAVGCNAPWTSVVIEAHGAVRPCFFHPAVGNIRERPLAEILNDALPDFRRGLDVATNPTCQRCVCTLKVGLRTKLW
jgi:MoaA/NifB/PqqE/SkfB family radical SAM enzyme